MWVKSSIESELESIERVEDDEWEGVVKNLFVNSIENYEEIIEEEVCVNVRGIVVVSFVLFYENI